MYSTPHGVRCYVKNQLYIPLLFSFCLSAGTRESDLYQNGQKSTIHFGMTFTANTDNIALWKPISTRHEHIWQRNEIHNLGNQT